jgi:hypothetical protein
MWNPRQNAAKSERDKAREAVEKAVQQHIEQWAAAVGLTVTDQFREDVTEALHAFMRNATPGRWRWSTMRRAFLDLADGYAAIAKVLGRWESGGTLPPVYFDPRFKDLPQLMDPRVLGAVLASYGHAADFKDLAKAAQRYAGLCVRDEGSRPRFLVAFDALCVGDISRGGLLRAFEGATKRKATSSGAYFRLVTAVWPAAREIAQAVTKQPPLGPRKPGAMRKHLERLLKQLGRGPSSSDKTSDF